MSETGTPGRPASAPRGGRLLSLAEFALGAAIVIAHNIYHVVPNEVPILFVLAIVSIRLREGSFAAIGLGRPRSWWLTILIAIAAVLVLVASEFATEPLAKALGLHATAGAASPLGGSTSGPLTALKGLAIVWTFAAFGEEISYRRYLLDRLAHALGSSTAADVAGLIAASVLFGFGHHYQGPAGMFTTACHGFIIGAAYLLSRRNLWVAVLTHGLFDTLVVVLLFFGLAD